MVTWCCEWLDDLRHKRRFLLDVPCFYALQETDNWTTSAMNVLGYTACGRDLCERAILCRRQVSHFRRSWVNHQRCTANLVGCSMLLSVRMPTVDTMRKTTGLETPGEDFQGHDGIDWYGVYGTDCRGGGENVTTYERIRWQQLLQESNCTVTSTRADTDGRGECHTWLAWAERSKSIFYGTSRSSFYDAVSEQNWTWVLGTTSWWW